MRIKELDKIIKTIWLTNIRTDYDNGLILNEDTLKKHLVFFIYVHILKIKQGLKVFIYILNAQSTAFPL